MKTKHMIKIFTEIEVDHRAEMLSDAFDVDYEKVEELTAEQLNRHCRVSESIESLFLKTKENLMTRLLSVFLYGKLIGKRERRETRSDIKEMYSVDMDKISLNIDEIPDEVKDVIKKIAEKMKEK